MPFEPDHVLLTRYHLARERGDLPAAAEAWKQLGLNNWPRVQNVVKGFRFSAGSRGIPDFDQGSAASDGWLRLMSMGANFQKREPGQYYAALVTCVENACKDFGRREFRHTKRSAGSIDQRYDDNPESGPFDAALAAYERELRRRTTEAVEEELENQRAEELVAWAIDQVNNASYREVLYLTLIDKLTAEDIADRLGISIENVYQRRSRGMKELRKILRDHGS